MESKSSPFAITDEILILATEIAEMAGKVSVENLLAGNPVLRRANRLKAIQGSLAIEQNPLSLEQVTAVLNGKRVLAPPKDIAEVKNAYSVYEQLEELDPYSIEDLLSAHAQMMDGLMREAGMFRSGPVGVVDSEGNIVHFGTLPVYVPGAVSSLFAWAEKTDLPPLICSCVVHYELERIHPFADGNGRMGRLWQTLLLTHWYPLFAWLPVESIVHDQQQDYYDAINTSDAMGESTAFIRFMLAIIKEALSELAESGDEKTDSLASKQSRRWEIVSDYMDSHDNIQNAVVIDLLHVSSATATRLLRGWTKEGRLERMKEGRVWVYRKK